MSYVTHSRPVVPLPKYIYIYLPMSYLSSTAAFAGAFGTQWVNKMTSESEGKLIKRCYSESVEINLRLVNSHSVSRSKLFFTMIYRMNVA